VLKNSVIVALETLGCKLNQAETESLSREFASAGCSVVSPEGPCDIYILNTCSVTRMADAKSRQLLRQKRHRNPQTCIVALGCYAESGRRELERVAGVDLMVDNSQKPDLVQLLKERGYLKTNFSVQIPTAPQRTRSFIKAQDGCTNFCTYCIVPSVRGPEKSLPAGAVIDQIKQRVSEGFQEVVLTGTEIGRYQDNACDLKGLLARILSETAIPRLRLSSLQPQEVSNDLLRMWQDPRLCRHFHLSLQSGSDTVLNRMNRRYTSSRYRQAVELIRLLVPEAAVTTDIIVGFPGENEFEFETSRSFCREVGFARIHVFPYSPRAGTAAARMTPQVDEAVKRERARQMRGLAADSSARFCSDLIERTLPVLFEQKTGAQWSGLTGNYMKVFVDSDLDLTNRILNVRLLKSRRGGAAARLAD
jgi:threonylcarbamoyladenosine tRNA methylthiotransferase MtaB